MRVLLLVAMVGTLGWLAWPAEAGDTDKAELALAKKELARTSAELKHLREAYNQMSAQATRATQAITAMTASLSSSRDVIQMLTRERDALRTERDGLRADLAKRPDDDPARIRQALRQAQERHAQDVTQLQADINAWTERHNQLAVRMTIAEAKLAETEAALKAALEKK